MSDPESRIPEEIAPEVFALAARYYADVRQGFSASELVAAGSEVDIPAEFIQAIQEIQTQQLQKLEQQKVLATGFPMQPVQWIWVKLSGMLL